MATSNSRDFSLNVADVIEEAYELIGRELRTAYDAQRARRSLNIMFQDWTNRGINLWTGEQDTLSLVSGTSEYGLNSGDIEVIEAVLRRSSQDYPLERIPRRDYLNIPKKSQTGRPTRIYVERLTSPKLYLWPTPENSTDTVISYRLQRIQDADTLINDVDVPSRFIPPMVTGLAYYLALKLSPERVQMILPIYEQDFFRASNEDSERGSMYITPLIPRV